MNKVIWHHIWHLQCWLRIACDIEQSHMTSHMTFQCYPKVACDIIWCHFGVIWHHMWHVHGVGMCDRHCVIYTRYMLYTKHKQASAASLHRGGGHTASQRSAITPGMSCHVISKWHHMTSHVTFGCRPKGMMSRMAWKCDVIWHRNDITWCHMRLLKGRMRHEQKSYDITCDIGRRLKCHIWHHVTSYDMTCAVYRCCFSSVLPLKIIHGGILISQPVDPGGVGRFC